jgi:hypothetical protein
MAITEATTDGGGAGGEGTTFATGLGCGVEAGGVILTVGRTTGLGARTLLAGNLSPQPPSQAPIMMAPTTAMMSTATICIFMSEQTLKLSHEAEIPATIAS